MKKTIDRLAHKYALNIKQIRGQGPTKIGDFKNLNYNKAVSKYKSSKNQYPELCF